MRKLHTTVATLALVVLCPACAEPTEPAGRVMYFCGYDTCKDSGEYGDMIFETGINVWSNPDPDRGGVHHQASHHDKVMVVEEKRVNEGPGGLWYRLADGGWTNDFWLTEEPCTSENLEQYSFADCAAGSYETTSVPVGTKTNAYMRCRLHIKNDLENPSSAMFPHISTVTASVTNRAWVISGDFQAQDEEGGWFRADFECKVRYGGNGEWELIHLTIEERSED